MAYLPSARASIKPWPTPSVVPDPETARCSTDQRTSHSTVLPLFKVRFRCYQLPSSEKLCLTCGHFSLHQQLEIWYPHPPPSGSLPAPPGTLHWPAFSLLMALLFSAHGFFTVSPPTLLNYDSRHITPRCTWPVQFSKPPDLEESPHLGLQNSVKSGAFLPRGLIYHSLLLRSGRWLSLCYTKGQVHFILQSPIHH